MTFDLNEEKRLMLESFQRVAGEYSDYTGSDYGGDDIQEDISRYSNTEDPKEYMTHSVGWVPDSQLMEYGIKPWHHPMMSKDAQNARDDMAHFEYLAKQLFGGFSPEEIQEKFGVPVDALPRLLMEKAQRTEQVKRSFDIDSAIASRDQSFTPEPIQRADHEAFQRMDLFGRKRRRQAEYERLFQEEAARNRAAMERDPAYQKYIADQKRLQDYIARMTGNKDYAQTAQGMEKMLKETDDPTGVLREFRGHIDRFDNPNDPKWQSKPMTQADKDALYNTMNDDGVLDYLRGAPTSTIGPTTMKDGVIDGVQPGYQRPPAFQAAKPAEARLDQPDARDSSS